MKKKKWNASDVIVLVLDIATPIIAFLVTIIWPNPLSEDAKVAIISAGIAIPIVLLQASQTVSQKEIESSFEEIEASIDNLEEQVGHLSPIHRQILESKNERIWRFAYRKLENTYTTISNALTLQDSGELAQEDYYNELHHFADLLEEDFNRYGSLDGRAPDSGEYSGEIWAMTSFADDEWNDDQGFEARWVERLKEINDKGIKTRRICRIPKSVYILMTNPNFDEPTEGENKQFDALIKLLRDYYSPKNNQTIHYFFREQDAPDLATYNGFFAIKLSNGEMHILVEAKANILTAKALFNTYRIQQIRDLYDRYAIDSSEIIKKINQYASVPFKDYLIKEKIDGIENKTPSPPAH